MKIKIRNKGFQTTHFGYLKAGKEYDLPTNFATFCVEKMKSADIVLQRNEQKKQTRTRKAK